MSSGRLVALAPYDLDALPASLTGGVVAIGNFDGVHRGHAALLGSARAMADELGVPAVVLTFELHPRGLAAGAPLFRITPAGKGRLLKALNLDGLPSPPSIATRGDPGRGFHQDILIGRLRPAGLVVGYDFASGNRAGTTATMVEAGGGLPVAVFGQVSSSDGQPVPPAPSATISLPAMSWPPTRSSATAGSSRAPSFTVTAGVVMGF